jgi:hypothetical protein
VGVYDRPLLTLSICGGITFKAFFQPLNITHLFLGVEHGVQHGVEHGCPENSILEGGSEEIIRDFSARFMKIHDRGGDDGVFIPPDVL